MNSEDEDALIPDIRTLWYSLNRSQGNIGTRIIQWNDSWLITTLQKAFIELYKNNDNAKKYPKLSIDLEEIILNKKKLYAVVKRGSDSVDLVREIFKCAGITDELMDKIVSKEQSIINDPNKTYDPTNLMKDEKYNARDSIKQIERMRYILKTGNLEMFFTTMPLFEGGINEIINNVMEDLVKTNRILGYRTLLNTGRSKFGIPRGDKATEDVFQNIYFFDDDSKPYPMDVSSVLRPLINLMSNDSPYMFIYITPPDNIGDNKLSKEIISSLANAIGNQLRERFTKAFPNSAQECNQ